MNSKPSYYGVLPAQVRYDTALTNLAKLLYCEISALASKDGICFATNGYFSKIYGKTDRTIIRAIVLLEENGYIKITRHKKEGSFKVVKREIELMSKMSVADDKNVIHNNIKIINNSILLDKNVTKEIYKPLHDLAILFYTTQESNYKSIMPKWNNDDYMNNSINILYRLINKDGYKLDDISNAILWGVHDDFWSSRTLTLTTLRNKSKNGNTKFTNLHLAYKGAVKPTKYQGGILR